MKGSSPTRSSRARARRDRDAETSERVSSVSPRPILSSRVSSPSWRRARRRVDSDAPRPRVAYVAAPQIAAWAPDVAHVPGGAIARLTGADFLGGDGGGDSAASSASFASLTCVFATGPRIGGAVSGLAPSAPVAVAVSSALVACETPSGLPEGIASLTVTLAGSAGLVHAGGAAPIAIVPAPTVSDMHPTFGATEGGGVVVVSGASRSASSADDVAARVGSVAPVALRPSARAGSAEFIAPARAVGRDVVHVARSPADAFAVAPTTYAYRVPFVAGAASPTKTLRRRRRTRARLRRERRVAAVARVARAGRHARRGYRAWRGRIRRTRAASRGRSRGRSRQRGDDDARAGRAGWISRRRRLRNVRVSFRGRPRRRAAGGASRLGDDSVGAPARVVARRRRHRRRRRRREFRRRRDGDASRRIRRRRARDGVRGGILRADSSRGDGRAPSRYARARRSVVVARPVGRGVVVLGRDAHGVSPRAVVAQSRTRFRHGRGRRRVSPHRSRVPRRRVAASVSLRRRGGDSLGVFSVNKVECVSPARAPDARRPAGLAVAVNGRDFSDEFSSFGRRKLEFTYGPRLEVYGLDPNRGPGTGGTEVTVHGANFLPTAGDAGATAGDAGSRRRVHSRAASITTSSPRVAPETARRRRTPPCVVHRRTTSGSSPWKCARDPGISRRSG